MAKRGRPRKNSKPSRETKPREREGQSDNERDDHSNDRSRDRGSRDSGRGGKYGGRGSKEYTQVGKLFESKYGRDKYWGKVQREKLQDLIARLQTILDDKEAASFNVDLNGKWGPFMSVTNTDEYESKNRGGYSRDRGRNRDEGNDRHSDSDWGRDNGGGKDEGNNVNSNW